MKRAIMVFTLVELLITISVIAILVGMLLPALNKAKSAASRIACSGNLRQIGISLTIYTQQNNDFVPFYLSGCEARDFTPLLSGKNSKGSYTEGMDQKEGLKGIFFCPRTPLLEDAAYYRSSYSPTRGVANSDISRAGGLYYFRDGGGAFQARKLSMVHPSSVAVAESKMKVFSIWENLCAAEIPQAYKTNQVQSIPADSTAIVDYMRHDLKANFLYAGGHVKPHSYGKQFYSAPGTPEIYWTEK